MNKTVSVTDLRKDLYRVFRLFKDGGEVFIHHRRKIYVMSIQPTGRKVTTPYRKSKTNARNKIDPHSIVTGQCEMCADLTQNGICMNRKCETNI